MSKQVLTVVERRAMWKANLGRCFYCRELVAWDALRIDHIIPEYLAEKPRERQSALDSVGLPDTWDLRSYANLVPSCDQCNSRKHGRLAARNQLILWLTENRDRAAVVEHLRLKYERQARADDARVQIETAIALGLLAQDDIAKAVSAADNSPDRVVSIARELEFLDGVSIAELRPTEARRFLDIPLRLGAELPEGLELEDASGAFRRVRTCREYREATEAGYHPYSTFAIKMAAFFQTALGILAALEACRPSAKSYIDDPRIGLCDIHLVPASCLPIVGEAGDGSALGNDTIAQLVERGFAKITSTGSYHVEVELGGVRYSLREMLRADLNGDGFEDILVSAYARAVGGTLGLGVAPWPMTRLSSDALFERTTVGTSSWPPSF